MTGERDEDWARRVLSDHGARHELDHGSFTARVLSETLGVDGRAADGRVVDGRAAAGAPGPRPRSRWFGRPFRRTLLGPEPGIPRRSVAVRRRLVPVAVALVMVLVPAVTSGALPALARWTGLEQRQPAVTETPSLDLDASPAVPTPSPSPSGSGVPITAKVPAHPQWSSGGLVLSPRASEGIVGFKDPSVVRYGGRWHLFVTVVTAEALRLGYLSFSDWSQADSATVHYLDASPLGGGYRAAPQVFYFAPQKLWYLVYQTGNASYATNPDLGDPKGWSASRDFYPAKPEIVDRNAADGYWVDMWVSCDDTDCYLFSADWGGHLYRSQTARANFPGQLSPPVVVATEDRPGSAQFTSLSIYKVTGTGRYLMITQAYDDKGQGYYRSRTATSLGGRWTPLADTQDSPFAGTANVTFPASPWTRSLSQGELLRDGYDQTLTVAPCHLQYLYHGWAADSGGTSRAGLGLLTQTGPSCS